MRSYGQYCPIALAAEIFAERWTPIIIRNLFLGCTRFGEILDGAPGLPRSVLSQRLRILERSGVIACTRSGRATSYTLTQSGRELAEVCLHLGAWGSRWRQALPEEQDPYVTLWTLSRMIRPESVPRPRIVIAFLITDRACPNRFWLVLTRCGNEVCVVDPGYPENGTVTTDTSTLVRWYAGEVSLGQAQRRRAMEIHAPPWLTRHLAAWGTLNPYAQAR